MTLAVVTSTPSTSRVPLSPSGLASAPGSTSASSRGTSSYSVGDSRVRSVVQEVDFREQNSNVSNFVMPAEALLIAGNSISNSTRSKYKSVFKRFIVYGPAMGTNVLNYSFSQVLVIGFFLSIYSHKGSIGSILMARVQSNFSGF